MKAFHIPRQNMALSTPGKTGDLYEKKINIVYSADLFGWMLQ
jgi:hypothetical protein